MPAAVAGSRGAMAILLLLLLAAQGGARLRKTDLVRLLSSATLGPDELAALIRRSCLSFTPTGRDRADFVALGANPSLLREIDACARRGAVARRPPPAKPRSAAPMPTPTPATVAPAPPPIRAPVSGVRTGFVLGVGQHAAVGTVMPLPLLFEVRDTAGKPLAAEEVSLGVTNGHVAATRVATDSNGRVRVELTLGPKVGPVHVSAAVGTIERQATLYADPAAAVRLGVRCGEVAIDERASFAPRGAVVLRISAQDGFGNSAPVTGLQAATGDRGVLRIAFVGTDSTGGLVRVQPGDEGSTSLVIVASGRRRDVSAAVARQPLPGAARCP
jgi:hypothetical protein